MSACACYTMGSSSTLEYQQIMTKHLKNYESEFTIFMRGLHESSSGLTAEQAVGRALLWDLSPVLLSDQARRVESIVRQQAYPYQTKTD